MITPRRILSALIIVLVISLTGCQNEGNIALDPKNPAAITIWHYYHGAQKTAFDDAVQEFNESYGFERGIVAEAVSHGGVDELAANVLAAASGKLDAGELPNIFGSYGDTALEVLNFGKAVEIDSYLTQEKISEYEESFIHEGRIGTDKLYVFPIAKSTESLMLNKTDFDVFAEAMASEGRQINTDDLRTWEGIRTVAEAYYNYTNAQTPDIENDGKAFFGLDSLANYIIVASKQLGQDIVQVENKKATINTDREIMLKIWDTYYEPMVTGRYAKLGKFCSDDIKTGDSLCYIGSTSSANYFPTEILLDNEETKSIELLVLPMPTFENGAKVSISQGAGMVIGKSTKEKEYASALFLEWFTDSDRNVSFSLSSSYLPVKKESLDDEILNKAFNAIEQTNTAAVNTVQSLKIGIDQLRNYTMYSCDVFDGGISFRTDLPVILSEVAQNDRAAYVELLAKGETPEAAYEKLHEESLSKVDEWIASINSIEK